MPIENVPDMYLTKECGQPDLFLYDFKMTEDVIKTKVNLNMHMFSFLQEGRKQVHFSNMSIAVNKDQSLLLKKGNWLWTELLDFETIYFCRLLFFSDKKIREVLNKYGIDISSTQEDPYFTIANDSFINSYLESLSTIMDSPSSYADNLLSVKFEELILYLIKKYGKKFEGYLASIIEYSDSDFQNTIEKNTYSNLSLDEVAFLCNMSLSTFKRHFATIYKESPGKWLRNKRLLRAKELLENGNMKSSDIYNDFGYNSLSNFSTAFKQKFGVSPTDL